MENKFSAEAMKKEKRMFVESFDEMVERGKRLDALIRLSENLKAQENRQPIAFNDFLYEISRRPEFIFRDIFQLFYDMMQDLVGRGVDEYDSQDSIGFVGYNMSRLFVEGSDNPFFADRLFANRLMNLVSSFKQGSLHNHIFLFEGPPGSGKSTFLNNLLSKFEEYSKTDQGTIFKTYWRLDVEKLGGYQTFERRAAAFAEDSGNPLLFEHFAAKLAATRKEHHDKYLSFSCPRHDHPIIQVPKASRRQFLDELVCDEEFKEKLFKKKEYEWIFKDIPCNICQSIYNSLLEILGDPREIFNMIYAREYHFNRQFGEGISVNNPGDAVYNKPITNPMLQKSINSLLKNEDVNFVYSALAKTNNGVLALMDIKENNIDRLKNLHGIISDGVHKVELIEERIKSLFVGLVNPEDKVHYENIKSFQDRVITVCIPYVLDYNTEVSIYRSKFGEHIVDRFLPGLLENFAKIIISSRLDTTTPAIKQWISNPSKYDKYLDKHLLLLKMEIYTGIIPSWLSEEDFKRFNRQMRKDVLADAETEGKKGFSGRQSLNLFNDFYSKFARSDRLITMEMIKKYFSKNGGQHYKHIPDGFVESLESLYDYDVLQQVKEAIYYYNEAQISRDIQNYLFAINFDIGETKTCDFTGDKLKISEEYLKNIELMLLGGSETDARRKEFRSDMQAQYITVTLARDIAVEDKPITETKQFHSLFERYTRNIKANALAPYADNDNFRRAVLDYGTDSFSTYDGKTQRDVQLLLANLQKKFKYSEQGARQVSVYVLDKKLVKIYG